VAVLAVQEVVVQEVVDQVLGLILALLELPIQVEEAVVADMNLHT
jgi:hypothetical protein